MHKNRTELSEYILIQWLNFVDIFFTVFFYFFCQKNRDSRLLIWQITEI